VFGRFVRVALAVLAATGAVCVLAVVPAAGATDSASYSGTTSDGGQWIADIPSMWNGTVLLYSHGFGPPVAADAPDPATQQALLDRGYALAGSSYDPNGSWWALNSALTDQFETLADVKALLPHAPRLRYVVLLHMPLGGNGSPGVERAEGAVLAAAASVVVTSAWSRSLVQGLYRVPDQRIAVAEPGVDEAALVAGTENGARLLSVATVHHAKGHDVLVEALRSIAGMEWSCTCAGSLEREPRFARRIATAASDAGLAERLRFAGACSDDDLEQLYRSADVLVHPSRAETYGMVVAEALAHGLPVIASDVGGVPEALGRASSGPPGILVPPGDAGALAGALRRWLEDGALRHRLRTAAAERRGALRPWSATAAVIARACEAAAR